MNTLSERLSEFACGLRLQDMSSEVVDKVKECLLDFLGVAVAGSGCPAAGILASRMLPSRSGACSVIRGDCGAEPEAAALINGTCGHYLELDDGHKASISHPGTVVFPAALALSQDTDCSGERLIEAAVAGYDVVCRIGQALQPSHQAKRGFHTTGTCGAIGAAVAAGKVMGLDPGRMTNAIGLACLQASGLLEVMNTGGMSKPFQAGKAAASGVLSALLASDGMEAPSTALDGPKGFMNAMGDEWATSAVLDGIGKRFLISETYFKFHAACGLVHSSIDALLALRDAHGFGLDGIERIELRVQTYAAEVVGVHSNPGTPQEMKFSLPMSAAVAVVFGDASPTRYTAENLDSPEVRRAAHLMEVVADPSLDAYFPKQRSSVVTVHLKSGTVLQKRVDAARGHPENPATTGDLKAKFRVLAEGFMRGSSVEEVIRQVEDLENLPSAGVVAATAFERRTGR
ncbi:MAG: MmgE/PrpD family protein [Ignavibacteriales bacterium]